MSPLGYTLGKIGPNKYKLIISSPDTDGYEELTMPKDGLLSLKKLIEDFLEKESRNDIHQ